MNFLKFNNGQQSRRDFLRKSSLALPFVVIPQSLSALLVKEQLLHRTAFAMGTTVGIQAYHQDRFLVNNAMTKAFEELYRLDNLLSNYNTASDISKINRSSGNDVVAVHLDVINIVLRSLEYSRITNGAFDCTIEPLMKLWGFRDNFLSKIPSNKEIESVLNAVGYKNIIINSSENTIGLLHNESAIDLGGIAVGYTVDRMVGILKNEGIESALINHSGDLFAIGNPPEADYWKVGIPSPTNSNEIIYEVDLKDQALSTSGGYEKYIEINSHRFGHIINRFSGKPSKYLLSVSVIAPSSISADVFSTALFSNSHFSLQNIEKIDVISIDSAKNILRS